MVEPLVIESVQGSEVQLAPKAAPAGQAMTEIKWKVVVGCTDAEINAFVDSKIFGIKVDGLTWKR